MTNPSVRLVGLNGMIETLEMIILIKIRIIYGMVDKDLESLVCSKMASKIHFAIEVKDLKLYLLLVVMIKPVMSSTLEGLKF